MESTHASNVRPYLRNTARLGAANSLDRGGEHGNALSQALPLAVQLVNELQRRETIELTSLASSVPQIVHPHMSEDHLKMLLKSSEIPERKIMPFITEVCLLLALRGSTSIDCFRHRSHSVR